MQQKDRQARARLAVDETQAAAGVRSLSQRTVAFWMTTGSTGTF
jgi:hypothetical protein